jgi:CO/xanthine dehydrogenase FAD-binding subunit
LTTYWDIVRAAETHDEFPLLREASLEVGAVQIQTRGTWAGNIANCSPAADGVPAMMAYDTSVVLQNIRGSREVALHEFWSGYKQSVLQKNELIVSIRMPRRKRVHHGWHKVGSRKAQAITRVGVAAAQDRADGGLRSTALRRMSGDVTRLEAAFWEDLRWIIPARRPKFSGRIFHPSMTCARLRITGFLSSAS